VIFSFSARAHVYAACDVTAGQRRKWPCAAIFSHQHHSVRRVAALSCYVLAIKWQSRGGLWLSGEAVYAEASALKWTSHSIISFIAIVPVAGRRQEPLMHPTLSFNRTLFGGFLEKS
jgi:hypothetical protein